MAETTRDNNGVIAATGVLNTDGTTPTRLEASPTTHVLAVGDGTSGSDLGNDLAARDGSGVPVLIAVSDADGATPVNLYVDSNLLVDST